MRAIPRAFPASIIDGPAASRKARRWTSSHGGAMPAASRAWRAPTGGSRFGRPQAAMPGSSKCRPHSRFRPKKRVSSMRMPGSSLRVVWMSPIET